VSPVTFRICVAVYQREAQRQPGEGHREVITGSLGNPQGILDFGHRTIVGSQHALRYLREVDPGDGRGVGHGVGAAGHGQAAPLVVAPSRTTLGTTGSGPLRKGER